MRVGVCGNLSRSTSQAQAFLEGTSELGLKHDDDWANRKKKTPTTWFYYSVIVEASFSEVTEWQFGHLNPDTPSLEPLSESGHPGDSLGLKSMAAEGQLDLRATRKRLVPRVSCL